MKRTPWMKFYPADWRADPLLRSCSPLARAIWIDLIGLMHEAEPYGHLLIGASSPSVKTLSGLLNMHHKTLIAGLKELSERGVYSTTSEGVIYSRRMVRDYEKAIQDQENGRRGGNPNVSKKEREGVNPAVNRQVKAQKPEARSQIEETSSLRSDVSSARPKKPAQRTAISIDLPIPDAALAFASKHGFVNGSVEQMWTHFTAYHAAKGTLSASVEGHWRTWVLNQRKYAQEDRNGERIGAAGNFSAGPRAGARSQPRSAATIIMERALEDELDGQQQLLPKLTGN